MVLSTPYLLPVAALLASSSMLQNVQVQGFSAPLPNRNLQLAALAAEIETVTDVQEAVEILEQMQDENDSTIDEDTIIRLKNELIVKPDFDREELVSEVQDVLEEVLENMEEVDDEDNPIPVGDVTMTTAPPEIAESPKLGLMQDISRRFRVVKEEEPKEEVSAEEAAISASLYMNPATEKIAQHVKITWEPEAADVLAKLAKVSNPNRPFLVGIVGIPGSGKSTSAEVLAALLGEERAIVMPMDGFHIPLAELAEFPNAADAIYRRGAPDTFHAQKLGEALNRIVHGDESHVTIPGFDHAVGDPTPDQHTFCRAEHDIVICEGLYLLHDNDGWESIRQFFDWTIYIDANVDVCIERLKERNKCIPGYTPEEIEIRCDEVDRVNAETSRDGAYKYAAQIVKSGASS